MIKEELLPTAADVRFFAEQGYWLGGKVLSDAELEALIAAQDEVFAGRFETGRTPWAGGWQDDGDPTQIRKTDNAHWANRTISQLVQNPTIGAMAARLMQTPAVRLWHDQLLYKPGQGATGASRAGNVGWHQDHGYWRCTVPDLITAWVAFVDVPDEKGCMQVVPGSHQWGLLPESDFFNTDLETTKAKIEGLTGQPFVTKPCALKAGEVSFHHCLTIHGSSQNMTNTPRRSLVLHLMPEHARYIAGTPDDNHMNAILMREQGGKDGDAFAGELWPQMYPAVEGA
jgi:ectoine hydroxylase-related dioxygenase (phytanoyl-CoA dioxygenase family)